MALTYTQLSVQGADPNFVRRVQEALIQDCNANKVSATPPAATDVTIAAQRDKLGRKILADPHAYAVIFSRVVALQLIAKATLLDETVTTDADIFSAEGAIYDRMLPSL